ncbi:hypothetical protein CS022_06070 [Veronia nyctiphanis]|uniref:Protein SirB1 N-terminal domain-containing protein n=1 Tax=Veronia nyctiphanis TaxID=1278244 RepID=A0A4Q0YRQ7_9GAMM|nr:tetratricopeptide repeat protein [Veronia nyctiphanis]RXJ73870.1 hypothetical protein CS022_06070 [Veronia nyctiphanis]
MFEFNDQELESLPLVEAALALNAAIAPSTQAIWVKHQLEQMTADLKDALAAEPNDALRLEGLLRIFYKEWGFQGDNNQHFSSDNTFIDKVLERRQGIPVSLGALLVYFGRMLDLPLSAVAFPTQLVVRADWPGQKPVFVDPFNGEFITERVLRGWLVGHKGPTVQLMDEDMEQSDNATIIGRWLAVIKSAYLREEDYAGALRCSELALWFSPDDPYEIRDRGYIFQQLDCDWVAVNDYEYFIEQCPDDPAAELLKIQVKVLTAQEPTFH